jgi:integrase
MEDKKDLTAQDFKKFKSALEKMGSSQYVDFFTFMFNTGRRISDVLDLKFSDIDYKSNSISISQSKRSSMGQYKRNQNLSSLALNDECMQVLCRLKDDYPNDIFVFQSRKSKNQTNKQASSISRQAVTKAFKTASEITSLNITTNDLRHYYASQFFSKSFLQKNAPELLPRFIGHTPCTSTQDYVNNCHITNSDALNCLSAPKADMSNREPEVIEYLLNGGPLSKLFDLDGICQKYGVSKSDLTITLKTIKLLKK